MAVTDTTESNSPPTEPFVPITSRAWWHRHLAPEERRRVMNELAITRVEHWAWRFSIMLTLSVVVAVMGLSADSAAVVIGAMLLAPLMQPVLATAACLSMSLMRKSLGALTKVVLATAWCIAIAYLLSMLLPDGSLSGEVEARTRPDIRDLVVALAAGAAGAYATVRKDASSSLPGVAVAVALVPPLGTVGITLEENESALAIGAMLLYTTNLAAIIFAGVLVFIATGFVPPKRLANTALQLLVAAVIALAVVVVVAVPLFNRSAEAVNAAEDVLTARSIVESWLGEVDLQPEIDVSNDRVLVQLRGFDNPPDDSQLRSDLRQALGEDVNVNVQFIRTDRATTTTTAPPSDEETLLRDVEPVVDDWLADNDDGSDYDREPLRIVTNEDDGQRAVVINVTGVGEPPPVNDLLDRLEAAVGPELSVRLSWDPRLTVAPQEEATPIEIVEQEIEPVITAWAEEFDVEITFSDFDGARVLIEAIGSAQPRIDNLVDDLRDMVGTIEGREMPVDVFFTQQQRLTTTILVIDTFEGFVPTATTTTTVPGGPTPTSAGG